AEDLVSMADKIEQEFVSLDDITGGELYFGLAESCQIRYLAKEIRSFQKRYPNLRCHITSGDTEQVIDRLEKGLLDFAVLAETPDFARYDAIAFPEDDVWGLIVPKDHPFARCQEITPEQLVGQPLFASEQAWNNEIRAWARDLFAGYKLEGSFRLAYNGAVFTREGLGYLLTFEHLVDTSESSGLAFIPLAPRLTTTLYLVHSRFQACTPIALRFLDQIRSSFEKQAEQTAS
ncbi:MAG: LysR family transcriptional regulator substrate-binding protein, partial [Solobacterium sp.]|nr:LysR family transcriptional regulator substrate-binding protein [Solobacterium sp.]